MDRITIYINKRENDRNQKSHALVFTTGSLPQSIYNSCLLPLKWGMFISHMGKHYPAQQLKVRTK
jgi:hypothetical protein